MSNEQIMGLFEQMQKRIDSLEKQLSPLIMRSTRGVDENGAAILDVASLADENGTSIEELAEIISDHEERITALEGGE